MKQKRVKYRTVNVWSMKGIKEAEKLKENGWKINRSGLFTIQFYYDNKPA